MNYFDTYEDIERAEFYKLFAGLFMQEPSAEVLMRLKELFQLKFHESLDEVGLDFTRIFLGPEQHLPPYESLYNYPVLENPKLWGKATEEVEAFYTSIGLMMHEDANFLPDHISAEFLFMSYLIEQGRLKEQLAFMESHILKWIPDYCDALSKRAQSVFYKEIALLVKEFLAADYNQLISRK